MVVVMVVAAAVGRVGIVVMRAVGGRSGRRRLLMAIRHRLAI